MVIVTAQMANGSKVVCGMHSNYAEAFESMMDTIDEPLTEYAFHHVPQGAYQEHEMPILQQAA